METQYSSFNITETGGWPERADTAEQCTNVFQTNKNTALAGETHRRSNFRPPAPVGRINTRQWSGHAGIDTWWYNHILVLDTVSTARPLDVMKCGCLNGNKRPNKGRLVETTIMLRNVAERSESHPSGGRSLRIRSRVGSHGFRLSAHLTAVGAVAVLKLNISLEQNKAAKKWEEIGLICAS